MNTIETDAANKLDKIVQNINQEEGIKDYKQALMLAFERHPELAHKYSWGTTGNVRTYDLQPIEREMVLLQSDPGRVRFLAGSVMDHYARFDWAESR
jgi:hypothetical protein